MEKLYKFLTRFFTPRFFGTVTITFENGKVAHVEVSTRRTRPYKDLPVEGDL